MNVVLGTLPAEPDQQNEDFAAAAPGAAVLLDGAGVAGAETGCMHGIAWFSSTLGGLLLGNIAGDPARSLADCLADAIRGVRSLHEDTCDLAYRASPTSTVVAVRVGGGALEYLVLGDSTLLLAHQDGKATAVTDDRLDQVGKQLRAPLDRLPTGTPEHAAALAQYRDDLTRLRNRPGGFWDRRPRTAGGRARPHRNGAAGVAGVRDLAERRRDTPRRPVRPRRLDGRAGRARVRRPGRTHPPCTGSGERRSRRAAMASRKGEGRRHGSPLGALVVAAHPTV